MEQLFKCYVCEQYFDQYGLELHFVTTHNMDEDEEILSTAESDLTKHVKNDHEGNKNVHEKSKGVILESRDDAAAVRQKSIAVKAPDHDQQLFYITLSGQNDQTQKYMALCPKGMNQNTLNKILATKILEDPRNKGRQVICVVHQLSNPIEAQYWWPTNIVPRLD